jgi:hypothetical protein
MGGRVATGLHLSVDGKSSQRIASVALGYMLASQANAYLPALLRKKRAKANDLRQQVRNILPRGSHEVLIRCASSEHFNVFTGSLDEART